MGLMLVEPISSDVLDPVTVSTVWYSLQRTCREMRHLLFRTGQGFTIMQSKDASTGIWDGVGRTVAIPAGITPHFMGGKYSVEYVRAEYGENIYPGDVFHSNDPYRGGGRCRRRCRVRRLPRYELDCDACPGGAPEY